MIDLTTTSRPRAFRRPRRGALALLALFAVAALATTPAVEAADDPSIQGELRRSIQESMSRFIERNTIDGIYRHYDAVSGDLLELRLAELHSGIVKKGDFYVSCADFALPDGALVDLDFLVVPDGGELVTGQAIVHKRDGAKRPYHLEGDAAGSGD